MYKLILLIALVFILQSCKDDPYAEGSHWDYSISCHEGFKYKEMSHRGIIPVLNSDGTKLRCNQKRY